MVPAEGAIALAPLAGLYVRDRLQHGPSMRQLGSARKIRGSEPRRSCRQSRALDEVACFEVEPPPRDRRYQARLLPLGTHHGSGHDVYGR